MGDGRKAWPADLAAARALCAFCPDLKSVPIDNRSIRTSKEEVMIRKDRKFYRKPEIKRVRLLSKQAVLANCKTGPLGEVACLAAGDLTCGSSTATS